MDEKTTKFDLAEYYRKEILFAKKYGNLELKEALIREWLDYCCLLNSHAPDTPLIEMGVYHE